jgi:hypothetical protein
MLDLLHLENYVKYKQKLEIKIFISFHEHFLPRLDPSQFQKCDKVQFELHIRED